MTNTSTSPSILRVSRHRSPIDRSADGELRAISTRAAISRTSFSNYYTFGDLKANPRDLLVRYFDASVYFANWLFLEVAFRYPRGAVDVKALRRYAAGHTLEIRSTAHHVVVALSVEGDGESFDAADDGRSWLSSLIALRADIARGDERALYLGWLLDVQCGEIDDDVTEPARPEGLGNLSPALHSLVDIIGLDRDLLAAAQGGPHAAPHSSARKVSRWLTRLDTAEHVALLARVARGDGGVATELMRRFRQHTRRHAPVMPLRTAGELGAREAAIAGRPSVPFEVPDGVTFAEIDRDTGKLALPNCPRTFTESFLAGTEPGEYCEIHRW